MERGPSSLPSPPASSPLRCCSAAVQSTAVADSTTAPDRRGPRPLLVVYSPPRLLLDASADVADAADGRRRSGKLSTAEAAHRPIIPSHPTSSHLTPFALSPVNSAARAIDR